MKMKICPRFRAVIKNCGEAMYLTRYIDNLSADEMTLLLAISNRKNHCRQMEAALRASGNYYVEWSNKVMDLEYAENEIERLINEREALS